MSAHYTAQYAETGIFSNTTYGIVHGAGGGSHLNMVIQHTRYCTMVLVVGVTWSAACLANKAAEPMPPQAEGESCWCHVVSQDYVNEFI